MLNTNKFAGVKTRPTPEYVPQSRVGRFWWVAGIVVAAVAGLLLSLTRFGFFLNEDFTLVSQFTSGQQAGPLGYFTRDWGLDGKFYAPLPRLGFWVEYQLFHNTAYGWHIVSALLHTGCAVLVWLLAWRLTRRPALALIAGLFFAAFPGHVPVVGQISAQADLWATLFCLASAVTFLYARQTPFDATDVTEDSNSRLRSRFYYLSIAFYGLALLSKQEAIALPLALLAFDFVTGGIDRLRRQTNRQELASDRQGRTPGNLLGYYAPYLVLLALYLLIHLAFLGGLSAYTGGNNPGTGLGDFLKNNLRGLAQPFSLGGTDGLILIAALLAFLCLTGVQEWEAWQLNNPHRVAEKAAVEEKAARQAAVYNDDDDEMDDPMTMQVAKPVVETPKPAPVYRRPLDDDDEMDDPETFAQPIVQPVEQPATTIKEPVADLIDPESVLTEEVTVETAPPLPGEDTKAEPVAAAPAIQGESRPAYWTLRAALFGFLWTGLFLLPFIAQANTNGPLYLASAGFALFLAAALAPFGTATVHRAVDKKQARSLFGHFELSYWLRVAAVVVLVCVYFAATVGSVSDWNGTTKPVGMLLKVVSGL